MFAWLTNVPGAFFVIGFDAKKTWLAGIGRVIGLVAGVVLGLLIANLLGPGLLLDVMMVAACGLSFATMAVHPGAWMFFFMIFVAIGWQGLAPEAFDLALRKRFYGESAGVVAAMVAIVFLQWWQSRRVRYNFTLDHQTSSATRWVLSTSVMRLTLWQTGRLTIACT
jgi:uncharacterized membrane protein YccC